MRRNAQLFICLMIAIAMLAGIWGCAAPVEETTPLPLRRNQHRQPPERTLLKKRSCTGNPGNSGSCGTDRHHPANPQRIATMQGPSYEMLLLWVEKTRLA